MTADRPLLGILLMLGFCVLAPLGDGIAKLLGETMALLQILIARFAVQALALAPLVWAQSKSLRFSRRIWRLTVQRTVLHIIGIGAMFTSLRYLPLADAIAIAFVMPFIMLLLGKFVLEEQVGPHRLAACVVGFLGTLLVIQPNFVSVGAAALLPLLVAVVFALFMLTTRQMAKEVDPITLQAVSGALATGILLVGLLIGRAVDSPVAAMVWDNSVSVMLLLAAGLIGTVAHLLMTWSLRFAPSATLAPMQYLEIPFATVIGYLLFRDLPKGLAALGIAVTVSAGLYIIMRERRLGQQALASQTPQTPPAA
ncbi:DMT family transporter [Cognatishimia sp. MH4019]|uniref:DMT family transporter n=1 Tax=Cognatishimia sp. MH4019 TaxID=2854030 RepID=UPI001CD4D48D|nr:DMT family transporter [Cognatishimia sp. MH4019]